jgi:hypothetical protein
MQSPVLFVTLTHAHLPYCHFSYQRHYFTLLLQLLLLHPTYTFALLSPFALHVPIALLSPHALLALHITITRNMPLHFTSSVTSLHTNSIIMVKLPCAFQ